MPSFPAAAMLTKKFARIANGECANGGPLTLRKTFKSSNTDATAKNCELIHIDGLDGGKESDARQSYM